MTSKLHLINSCSEFRSSAILITAEPHYAATSHSRGSQHAASVNSVFLILTFVVPRNFTITAGANLVSQF